MAVAAWGPRAALEGGLTVAKCTPEQLSRWLFVHLEDSPLSADIPRENLSLICERAVNFFFAKDVLALEGVFNWLIAEYNVPREKLASSFGSLKIPASELGVFMQLPGEENEATMSATLPGDRPLSALAEDAGETFDDDELPHESAESSSVSDDDEAPVWIPEGGTKAPAPASAGPVVEKARPKRHWQMLPPKSRDPVRSLSGYLNDTKYFEFVFLDYALDGDARKEQRVRLICSSIFRLREHEKNFYRNPALEPGSEADTIEAWAVRLNGLALAFALAKDVAGDDNLDQSEWLRGVRQLKGVFGDLTSRILIKLSEAKKIGGDTLSSFESAWSRLRFSHESLAGEIDRISKVAGKEMEEKKPSTPAKRLARRSPAAKVVIAEPEAEGLRALIKRFQFPLIVGALLLLVLSLGYAIHAMGVFKGEGTKEVKLDISALGFTAEKELTDGTGLVVMIKESEWTPLSDEDKKQRLAKLYEIAVAGGFKQAQVRSSANVPLGLALSPTMIKVLR
jgi:hypothetical protein